MQPRPRPVPWRRAVLLAAVLAVSGGGAARADTVTTKDGKTYEGKVLEDGPGGVVIETTFHGRKEVPRADVAKVDTKVPPLREQFAWRLGQAKDVPSLADLAAWAKAKGFTSDVDLVWRKVLELDPGNVKAHKALGHVHVGGKWLTPEEKEAADRAAEEEAQRAKGLVPYQGRWVTPEEKAALEKGLLRDGDEWVTEEEYHRRRGERRVDGQWVRVGEAQGRARAEALGKALGATLSYLWGPKVDVVHELSPEEGALVLEGATKAADAFAKLLRPGPDDRLDDLRIEVFCAHKAPLYARYAQHFAEEAQVARIAPAFETWAQQASRARSFWWPHPAAVCGQYLFPNTIQALQSAVAHNVAQILLTRYRFNFRFPSPWLTEGVAYVVEMQALGRTSTFTVGRSGIPGGGDPAAWQDPAKWRDLLRAQMLAMQDTPFPRLAAAQASALTLPDLVKAWSVADMLVALDRSKFEAFVDASKDREKSEEDALRGAYGMDYRQVEERWRAWADAGFHP